MSETQAQPRRRWRDDPLSVFLAGGALLLAVMYFLEQRQSDDLLEATRRAQSLGAGTLSMDGCLVSSAGSDGAVLAIRCNQPARASAAAAAQRSPDLVGFAEVVFIGSDEQLVCAPAPATWLEGCASRPLARQL